MNKIKPKLTTLVLGLGMCLCLLLISGVARAAYYDVTLPGDAVTGVPSNNYPAAEDPPKAIDNNEGTKLLHFDKLNTGFAVTPSQGKSRLYGISFLTANDGIERDPTSYLVEGSDDGTTWNTIASGNVALSDVRFAGPKSYMFTAPATASYAQYRVTFPTVKNAGAANSMQIAEVELLGVLDTLKVMTAHVIDLSTVRVAFSRPVDITAATFTLDGGAAVASAALQSGDNFSVLLTTTAPLTSGTTYNVGFSGVVDPETSAVLADGSIAFAARPAVSFAVNFEGGADANTGCPLPLLPTDIAGLVPVGNWNNCRGNGITGQALNDVNAGPTPMTISFSADESWGSAVGQATANDKLMNGYLGISNGPTDGAPASFTAGNYRPIWVNNVSPGLYKVIVYCNRDGAGQQQLVAMGNEEYHVRTEGANEWNGNRNFRRGTSTSINSPQQCNYVQFDATPVSGTMKLNIRAESFRAILNGFQVVPVAPEVAAITTDVADVSMEENYPFTFTVNNSGNGSIFYQWYMNETPIPGATGKSYTGMAMPDIDQATFKVVITQTFPQGGGTVLTSEATLTVTPDVTSPTVVKFYGGWPVNNALLAVTFSERVSAETAQNPGNYILTGDGPAVVGAELSPDQLTVVLTIDPPLSYDTDYTLDVSEVYDIAGTANVLDPNPTTLTFHTPSAMACNPGKVKKDVWLNLGTTQNRLDTITNDWRYPNLPNYTEYTESFTNRFNDGANTWNGARLTGYIIPPDTGWYQFSEYSDDAGILNLSPDADPAHRQTIIYQGGCCSTLTSSNFYLVKGIPYYMEAIYENGTGGDYIIIQWKPPGASAFQPIPSTAVSTCEPIVSEVHLVSAYASAIPNQVVLTFSQPLADIPLPADPAVAYAFVTDGTTMFTPTDLRFLPGNDKVVVTLDNPLVAGVAYTVEVGGSGVMGRADGDLLTPNPSTAQFTGLSTTTGAALREVWLGIPGTLLLETSLFADPDYPCNPSQIGTVDKIESPANIGDNYGVRIRGYIIPPETANYQFQLRGDDSCLFSMSLGTDPAQLRPVVIMNGFCCNDSIFSSVIPMVGGNAYYFEAVVQEWGGGDFLQVNWKNNASIAAYTVVPGSALAIAVNPATIDLQLTAQPTDLTVTECRPAVFVAGASASTACGPGGTPVWEWFKNGNPIAGATGPTLTILPQYPADNGAQIYGVATIAAKSVSTAPVTLTVEEDTVEPQPVKAVGHASLLKVFVTFSEDVDPATASGNSALPNYLIQDSQGQPFGTINPGYAIAADMVDSKTVALTLDAQMTQGELYTVTVNNVYDLCVKKYVFEKTVSFKAWLLMPYALTFDVWSGIGGGVVTDLTGNQRFINNTPDKSYFIGTFNTGEHPLYINDLQDQGFRNDYGGRVSGWFKAPADGNYKFYLRSDDQAQLFISSDADPANKVMVFQNECCNDGWEDGRATADITLVAGQMYYIEGLYKEGGGGDYIRVAVRLPGDTTPTGDLLPIGPQYLWTIQDPDAYITLTPANVGPLTVRGFNNYLVQITNSFTNNTMVVAESVLAGTYVGSDGAPMSANLSTSPRWSEPGIINYNVETANFGRIRPDVAYPGVPYGSGYRDNFTMETLTYVQLTAGFHAFGIVTDDNFRLYNEAQTVGEFNFPSGRGWNDTVMRFYAPVDGLYAMRMLMVQGTGGGNVEWWNADAAAYTVTAINGSDAIPAFRAPDQNPPVITCPQALSAECGVAVNFNATAIDPEEGNVAVTCVPASGGIFPVGESTVICTAVDAFGNTAQCQFPLIVTDTADPVLTCPANSVVFECAGPNGRAIDLPVSATDACAGAITPVCVPASGSMFPLGDTTVNCTATDASGNDATCSFVVTVVTGDTTLPIVNCPTAPVLAECAGPQGTPVIYTTPTAIDNCDGTLAVTCVPASGSIFPLGDTTVACEATDLNGNKGTCSFIVKVVDTVAPELLDCVDKSVCGSGPTVVSFDDITAIDICGTASVICVPPSGSEFQCGETTVTCTASDGANTAQCTFKVTVKCDQPSIAYTINGNNMTLRWTKTECSNLYYRDNNLGVVTAPATLDWTLYAGEIVDEGTTMSATFPKNSGIRFFLLK